MIAVLVDAKAARMPVGSYLWQGRFLVLLTAPLIYACLVPFLLLDGAISLYQAVCFPLYGIPVVARRKHFVFDRAKLRYLNWIEKMHCLYCSYANGVASYVAEIAARTEQHWCPIKHQSHYRHPYSRHDHFLPYGDAAAYRNRVEEVRRDFSDLKQVRHFTQGHRVPARRPCL
jgi:hypothetical protein